MFQNKVIVITGGANGIGKCIAEEFTKHKQLIGLEVLWEIRE